MKPYRLSRQQWLPAPLETIFPFFSRPENLQTLTPPFLDFKIVEVPAEIQAGSLIRYKLRLRGIPIRWTTKITEWTPPHGFVDEQLSGPYALWHHEHRFVAERGGTTMFDTVDYALPFGVLAWPAYKLFVRRDVESVFDYREKRMRELFGG
jgi:ligand-binding SRPBCC domain-containing protein